MLFTIELSNAVTSIVILTKIVLFLILVEDGVLVPRRNRCLDLGTSVSNFALQNVDCTRNKRRGIRNHSHRDAFRSRSLMCIPSSTASETTSKALASATEGICKRRIDERASCVCERGGRGEGKLH